MKKFFIILFTLMMTLNFISVVNAETLQEAIDAQKDAKEQKKQDKAVAKIAKKENIKTVMKWAEEGDIQAQIILSYAYRHGLRVKHSYKLSDHWKAEAEKVNKTFVQNFIPIEYYKKKLSLVQLYSIAAYHSQVGTYVKPNYEDALRWAQLGALELHPKSLAFVGAAYYTGRGVQQDYKVAMKYFKQSTKEPLTLLLLSDAYAKGNGVEKDLQRSKTYANYLKLVKQKEIDEKKAKNLKKKEQAEKK